MLGVSEKCLARCCKQAVELKGFMWNSIGGSLATHQKQDLDPT